MEKPFIVQNLYKQFLCGKYCDLQIQVENSFFQAHRCVVAASSWVLEAILQSSALELEGNADLSLLSIELHGVTAYAISSLLEFIYTGKFPFEAYADGEKRTEVLHAADLYKMEEVQKELKVSSPTTDVTADSLQSLKSANVPGGIPDKDLTLNLGESSAILTNQSLLKIDPVLSDNEFHDNSVKDCVKKLVAYTKKYGILYCVLCGQIFSTRECLIAHMTEHRSENKKYLKGRSLLTDDDNVLGDFTDDIVECGLSPETICSGTQKESYACAECEISYSAKDGLIKHMNIIHPDSLYCKHCTDCFDTVELLQLHLASRNADVLNKDAEAGVEAEGEIVKKTKQLRKTFNCTFCPMSFLKRRDLNIHRESSHGLVRPRYTCTTCGKEFKEKCALRVHTRTHTGEKPYTCSHCGNRFADAKTWKDHERRHRGEKPFVCAVCGKSFTYRQSFTRHMKFHDGKRPFQCSVCEKTFVLRQNLKEHEKRHKKQS